MAKKKEYPPTKESNFTISSDEPKVGVVRILPLIPMRDLVMFPSIVSPFFVGRKKSLLALDAAMAADKLLFLVTQKSAEVPDPGQDDLFKIGVIGKIVRAVKLPNATMKVVFEGLYRGEVIEVLKSDLAALAETKRGGLMAKVRYCPMEQPGAETQVEIEIFLKLIKNELKTFAKRNEIFGDNSDLLDFSSSAEDLCNLVAPVLNITLEEKQALLEQNDLKAKLEIVYATMVLEEESRKIEEKVRDRIQKQIGKNQKEYFLNEQLRAIQKELGADDAKSENQELEKKILNSGMTKEALEVAKKELKKLTQSATVSSEANVIRNYLDWLVSIPWKEKTPDNLDLQNAKSVLDKEHFGLREVKDRILEFIAISHRQGKLKGPVLCLVGPPGVGKTSLAKSVAHALGRNFVRMSLGGIRDEAEIRGHRRTYVGALPGKIVHAMKKAKTTNPLMLLDEIDKIYPSHMGDPAAALLEALDREQNYSFMDHYLEVEYDLSNVLFFATANSLGSIPHPLRDRMEVIELAGYSESEKLSIFEQHLIEKQLAENGLIKTQVKIPQEIALELIRSYTKEGGIRELERTLGKVYRKANRELLENTALKLIKIDTKKLVEYLGPPKYLWGKKEKKPLIGVVSGLSWSIMGGDLLTIEVVEMPGRGRLVLTGKLGSVMKESAYAAFSYIKANAEKLGIPQERFKIDLHVHAPEGAVPKDGPSAGVALATALVSTLLKVPVKNDLAMTGEITLRGRILPIGGLKEKILAAARAQVSEVFIPTENEKDLFEIRQDLPEIFEKVRIRSFSELKDLLPEALQASPGKLGSTKENKPRSKPKAPKKVFPPPLGKDSPDLETN